MSRKRYIPNLEIEHAHIIYRNFKGEAGKYNKEGERGFSVVIDDPQLIDELMDEGWPLKPLKKRDPDDPQHYHLQVKVGFEKYPPDIFMITRSRNEKLDEGSVASLDYAELRNVDLVIRPRQWEDDAGNMRVKAYLKEMYAVIEESRFAERYNSGRYGYEE